ncbi:metallophosphoesterase [Sulfobacillus sp. hq2]|uniref:metallophosphoesterase family protein n=1 Tax=Sulfobacillus TaxID=28033 RepID=UPI000CD3195E|nr:YfcE family phosphodiesterase [Sulfobacillus sp. hq2]POB11092.1 hypothetical protein CO251_05985 [Sulfobacillus sp. hq2]
MRYVVISDTHGRIAKWANQLVNLSDVDGLICAGDFYRDGLWLAQKMGVPYYGAQGNNDHDVHAPWATFWQSHGVRFGVIHGHQWPASQRLAALQRLAHQFTLQVLVFGHSHKRESYHTSETWIVNPGAGFRPVQSPPSFGWLTYDAEGSLNFSWDVLS